MFPRKPNNKIDSTENFQDADRLEKFILYAVAGLKVPDSIDKEQVWADLEKKIEKDRKLKIRNSTFTIYAIAATILVLLTSGYLLDRLNNKTFICPRGKQTVLLLPDKSRVQVNSSTKINYKLFHWKENRKVILDGEAFFEVKKGGKFEVVTKQGTITVVGTSFNVFARENSLNVVCKTGIVVVSNKNSIVLKAGDGCRNFNYSGDLEPYQSVIVKQTGWLNGKFWFENALLTDVFKEIERQFNVNLFYTGNLNRYYTGYFENGDLEQALKLVCLPMQLSYKINNNKIIINSMYN
jgi:transmembrane sensor